MDPHIALAVLLCFWVGLSLGLLGGGGSVLMVPLFVYVAKIPVHEALAMSLVIGGLSSAAGLVKYLKRGFVNKRLILLFGLPGVIASFLGGRFAKFISTDQLLLLFGGMMILISLVLFRRVSEKASPHAPVICRPHPGLSVTVGLILGFLTGLLGVGGGFLIVPAIAILMKCSLHTAIGTSLAIIAVNSSAGLAGRLSSIQLNIPLTAVFLTASIGGALGGTQLSDKFSTDLLQKIFAALIFLVGLFVVVQHVRLGPGVQ